MTVERKLPTPIVQRVEHLEKQLWKLEVLVMAQADALELAARALRKIGKDGKA